MYVGHRMQGSPLWGAALAAYFEAVQATTVSKLYYKYVNKEANFNLLHWSNDEFPSKETIDFNKMHQSLRESRDRAYCVEVFSF